MTDSEAWVLSVLAVGYLCCLFLHWEAQRSLHPIQQHFVRQKSRPLLVHMPHRCVYLKHRLAPPDRNCWA